jgi:hypothetical protein
VNDLDLRVPPVPALKSDGPSIGCVTIHFPRRRVEREENPDRSVIALHRPEKIAHETAVNMLAAVDGDDRLLEAPRRIVVTSP